ncbi:hypothetical protein BGW39_005137 [Mortierella sp. 14UC]|nr:hypothetical protein BGW39_005137 [Mortierella sp. 14UC]
MAASRTAPDATHLAYKNTDQLSVTLKEPTSFKLLYFPIHSNGAASREILSIAEAKWESLVPRDWEKDKEKTPFNVLPVLFISSPSNKDVILAEAGVIEQYLAKQFGLMGDNEYEENLIKNERKKAMETFRDGPFRAWVTLHEKHLRDNGSNGHYVGDKLTLADIRTANLIEHLNLQIGGQALYDIINRTTCLRKLRVEVAFDHRVSTWRSSQAYRALTDATRHYFSDPFAPAPKL